ncbi:hypothetical protein [Ornithinimicrobium sp. INDO-MA30-4]|uniref:hypothetical protein n=1 Tax=Ornithinimicrobium sp. INDO-MA30-4 TaxID=2908651 RepID=UPI001F1A5172|nr:hypothetical protein [Ornithinimicrobium sp. INDO-MA30-4]UJH70824.1 hypothetical protein L0A91_02080 [Ornithinimicrobium sp. INDO-MA30-4]
MEPLGCPHPGWSAEADRIWALLASADPGTRVALEQRWEELTVSIRSGRQTLSGLDDELDEHAVALGQQIRDSWPAQLVRDGINGYGIYKGTTRGFTGLTQAALGTGILSLAVQLSRAVDVAARSRILSDIRLFSDLARRVGPVARVPLRFVPVASVVSTASTAIPDLIDGNDYEGWRGTTTQVLAGGALVGSVAISIPTPVTVGTGAVVVGAYTAWMGGNAVYDNRAVIMRYGSLGFAWASRVPRNWRRSCPIRTMFRRRPGSGFTTTLSLYQIQARSKCQFRSGCRGFGSRSTCPSHGYPPLTSMT